MTKNDMKCRSFGTGILCKRLYNIVYKNWDKVLHKNRCRISSPKNYSKGNSADVIILYSYCGPK